MSKRTPYMDLLRQGKVASEDIDDFVDRWHESSSPKDLSEYLGMSPGDYAAWVEDPGILPHLAGVEEKERS